MRFVMKHPSWPPILISRKQAFEFSHISPKAFCPLSSGIHLLAIADFVASNFARFKVFGNRAKVILPAL